MENVFEYFAVAEFFVCVFVANQPDVLAVVEAVKYLLQFFLPWSSRQMLSIPFAEIDCIDSGVVAEVVSALFEFVEKFAWRGKDLPVVVEMGFDAVHGFTNYAKDEVFTVGVGVSVLESGMVCVS